MRKAAGMPVRSALPCAAATRGSAGQLLGLGIEPYLLVTTVKNWTRQHPAPHHRYPPGQQYQLLRRAIDGTDRRQPAVARQVIIAEAHQAVQLADVFPARSQWQRPVHPHRAVTSTQVL